MNKENSLVMKDVDFTPGQIATIKETVANGASDNELKLFLYQCSRTGLDPLSRQIHFIKRGGKATIQTGIDGFRAIAERTGKYAGNDDYLFNNDMTMFDMLKAKMAHPITATSTVHKIVGGVKVSFAATAIWEAYCPQGGEGFMWKKMPYLMLGKCAEALALRKAFPNDLSGVYTDDEMQQAAPPQGIVDATGTGNKIEALKEKVTKAKEIKTGLEEDEPMTDEQRLKIESLADDDKCADVKEKVNFWLTGSVANHTFEAAELTIKKLGKIIAE
tara:strand:+ start:98 stop:919 length:822 start_codon:yes stop_codon:yes gene_type:complete